MAESFQPKFVDLVRNYTSTTGTGNLTLDEAPPGFKSFTGTLQPGDSFYYSVAGLENTTETEVGRGTLQADGSIARQPIGGSLVNFSTGKKTVALVAAAEWFESVDALRGAFGSAATLAELAALPAGGAAHLSQAGRAGLFLFDSSNLSAKVSADTGQGLFVAPASAPTGASGAWVRQHDGWLRPEWFGAAGDGAANDQPAFDALNSVIAVLDHANIRLKHGATYLVGKHGTGTFYRSGANAIDANGLSHFILDMNGATLKTNPNLLFGRFDPATGLPLADWTAAGTCPIGERAEIGRMVRVQSTPLVHIFNGNLDGNSASQTIGGKTDVSGHQLMHYGLWIRDCDQVLIDNLHGFNFLLDAWLCDFTALTEADEAKPFTIRNSRFYNVGRNVGTIGAGNSVLLENVCHKYQGAPISGGGYLTSNPRSALDIETEAGDITRNVRIVGGTYEQGLNGNTAIVIGSGDTKDVLIDGAHMIGVVWLEKPRCVIRNSKVNGYFGALLGGQADPGDNALIDNCQVSDITYNDTPQLNSGGSIIPGNARGDGVTIRNSSFYCKFLRLNLRGMKVHDTTFRIAFGTDIFANQQYFAMADVAATELRRVKFIDEIAANIPADAYFVTQGNNPTIDDCTIVSSSSKLKWNSWSAGSAGYTGAFDNAMVVKKELAAQKRLGAGGGFYGSVSVRFNNAAPADAPVIGTITINENPGAGQALGWRYLSSGAHEAVFGLTQLQASGSGLTLGASDRLLGRASAGAGGVEEIACTAAGRALMACADAIAQRAALGVKRGFSFHCSGAPAGSEVIGGGIAPYAMSLSAQSSSCRALVSATGATTLSVRKNGSEIGTIAFAAGGTSGTVTFTAGAIAAGDQITVHNPAPADATLADIDGLLSE